MDLRNSRPLSVALLLAVGMLTAAAPSAAQEESPFTGSGSAGLASLLPDHVGGLALEPTIFTFAELVEQLDGEDPEQATAITALETLAASLGVATDQAYFGVANAADLETEQGVVIYALEVPGMDGAALIEPFIELLLAATPDLFLGVIDLGMEEATVGGKDVILIGSELLLDGEFGDSDRLAYGTDDVAIYMQGFEASILEVLDALP